MLRVHFAQSTPACEMRPKRVAKVVLVGDSGVGKSTILSTYTGEPFSSVYFKTRGEVVYGVPREKIT